jgi:ABC-type dipeptide/oligopeptide/nickel transport system permease subunit
MRMKSAIRVAMGALALVVVLVMATGPAMAQPTYPPTSVAPTSVAPKVDANAEEPGGGVLGGVEGQGEGVGALAFTGAELTLLVGAFALLLAGGAIALIAARRRSRPETA